jgi:hypothetical protein
MPQETLETRVARLERQVSMLMRSQANENRPAVDAWRKTVGMFQGDPIFGEMIEEAKRLREEDRRPTQDATEQAAE